MVIVAADDYVMMVARIVMRVMVGPMIVVVITVTTTRDEGVDDLVDHS